MLSDHEKEEFAKIAARLNLDVPTKWKVRRVTQISIAAFVIGLVGLVATFTWSILLGLFCLLVMGAGLWGVFVLRPRMLRDNRNIGVFEDDVHSHGF